ncbi:hypothetical protein EJB05_37762 [Eragrostis curvula]|uniref:NADP-dependent oxidoreductase domain-containing protein n=1 Tax=Eragrostis curvula TaxID=38414 RepID=A0A5J9TUG5_9POAL|nr:hypothetical protein EJB05_37762 [Eragrostis curvula]
MRILNFCPAYAAYTSPATPSKQRESRKQLAMASPTGRSSICHLKIPDFLVGSIGQSVPAVGLGMAFHPFVAEDVKTAVVSALELGYRHIDTAALYASERVVGEAMAEAVQHGIVASREELFVTSKVWCTQSHPELVLPSLRESLLSLAHYEELGKALTILGYFSSSALPILVASVTVPYILEIHCLPIAGWTLNLENKLIGPTFSLVPHSSRFPYPNPTSECGGPATGGRRSSSKECVLREATLRHAVGGEATVQRQDTYSFICRNLQLEYVDLYLVHWPMAVKPSMPHFPMKREDIVPLDLSGVWQAMEECHRLGLAKMIGVSNFTTKKLQELLAIAKIPPAVNQVELNPTWQQKKLIEFCKSKGIHVAAYSPLGGQRISEMNPVRHSDVLEEIAMARGKSVAQISLRWIYEQGVSMVVKSLRKERLKENMDLFDWELSDEDRFKINQIAQRKLVTVKNLLCPEGVSCVDISDVDALEM